MADALRHFWSTWCNPQKRCHAAVKRYRQKCVFTPTGIGVNSSIGGSRIPPLSPQASHFHNPESRVLTILGTFGLRGSRRNGEGGESEGERLADFYQNFVSCLCWLNFYLRFFAVGGKALDRDEHVRWSAIHSGELEGRSAFGGTFSGGTRSSRPCSEGPACQVRLSEGRASHIRFAMLDYPMLFPGHDKRAPPKHPLEGPACQVRFSTFDHPWRGCLRSPGGRGIVTADMPSSLLSCRNRNGPN